MERRFISHYQTGEKLYDEGTIYIYDGEKTMWGTEWKKTIKRDDINWIASDEDGIIWIEYSDEEYGILIDFNENDIIIERQPVSDYVKNDIIGRLFTGNYKAFNTVEEAYFDVLHERAIRRVG